MGVAKNAVSTMATSAAGHANSNIAQGGMEEAAEDNIAINNKKAELNYKKIPSAASATASSDALRTASQG